MVCVLWRCTLFERPSVWPAHCHHKRKPTFFLNTVWLQDPQGSVVAEGSELSAVVTEIADVTAGPEEGSIALAKRVYAHLYEGNLNSRYCLLTIHSPAWPLGSACAQPCLLTTRCDTVPLKSLVCLVQNQ